ncbi:hypothetical protein G6F61_014700 [Rhizopus arrhizus]|nr:hypothetical protein G6F61_014700 [Rhizopus arrhizus]
MQHRGEMVAQRRHRRVVGQLTLGLRLLQARHDRRPTLATMAGQPVTHAFAVGRHAAGRGHHQAAMRAPAPGVGQHRVSQQFLDGVASCLDPKAA